MPPETESGNWWRKAGDRIYADALFDTRSVTKLAVPGCKYPFRHIPPQAIYVIIGKTNERNKSREKETLPVFRKK